MAVNVCDTKYWSAKFLALDEINPRTEQKCGNSPFKVVYAGTLAAEKYPFLMLDLAYRMRDVNCEFIIAGSGELEGELQKGIDALGINNLKLLGRLNEGIAELFHSANLLLLPGRGGVVISEALCMGCPVVVYQGDGVELDLLTSRDHGNIIETRTANDFANAIQAWIDDIDRQQRSAKACCEIMQKFSTENMAEVFETVFDELCSDNDNI